jgi:hypothetical protein
LSFNKNTVPDMSIYFKEKGLRFVKTYYHEFVSYAKKRWIGEALIDIY